MASKSKKLKHITDETPPLNRLNRIIHHYNPHIILHRGRIRINSNNITIHHYMTIKIIGLTGPKMVGKSTYAKSYVDAVTLSFATPIKEMLKVILPWEKYLHFKEEPIPNFPDGINTRQLLQSLGTEWGREGVYPNIWIDLAYKAALPYIGKRTIVFDDIRFPNEAWAIRRWGCTHKVITEVVHISRKGYEPDENDHHVSEAGLPKGMIDRWVSVDGDGR